jgi:UDP-N-acetylglucosamine--dolichyl-phosphate N-acetylglucosaminephosphotransferase
VETFIVEAAVAMFASYFLGRWIGGYFRDAGLVGKDLHKKGKPKIPTSAGIPVFLAFYFSAMAYVFLRTYVFQDYSGLMDVTASILTIFFVTLVGFLDDVNTAKGRRIGLKQWQKPLLTLPAAIPLAALRMGVSSMTLPFIGAVDFGILYPLVIVPLVVVGASNMVNLLAGLNGLEAGMGVIYLTSLSLYAAFHSNLAAKIIAFAALGAVAGIFLLNRYPAKFLPGDSLTYFLGAVLGTLAIVGNMETATLIAAMPFLIEGVLKASGRFKKRTVGYVKDGKIFRNDGIYSLPHIFMNGRYTERQVVAFTWGISAFFAALVWLV